jgi:hypothetical protein
VFTLLEYASQDSAWHSSLAREGRADHRQSAIRKKNQKRDWLTADCSTRKYTVSEWTSGPPCGLPAFFPADLPEPMDVDFMGALR